MPIAVVCPSCKAKLNAPDALLGKTIKCPGCKEPVLIKAAAGGSGAVAKAPVKKPAPVDDVEDLDDIEDITDEPRKPAKSKAKSKADDFEDLDDEDDRPKKKAKKGKSDDDDIEDLDDDDDRPKKKKAKGGAPLPSGPTNDSERTMGMLLYLSGFLCSCFGPLGIWLVKRGESEFVNHHGKQWLNLFITYIVVAFLFGIIGGALSFGLGMAMGTTGALIASGLQGLFGLVLVGGMVTLTIMAALKAKAGVWYRIPFTMQLLK